jgi:hypothetical protein
MLELLIRPSLGDHKVLADLMAPSPLAGRRPIDRLVLNAHDIARSDDLIDAARRSGTAVIIDPLTMLLQGQIDPQDPWVLHVSFGQADAVADDLLTNPFWLDELVARAVEFQVDRGATAIVAPYFYADRPDSPAFGASLAAIGRTARRMRTDGVALPLIVVLCAQLQGFAHRLGWQAALDRFAAAAIDVGPQAIALHLSPVGDGGESYAKLLDLLVAARHLRSAGTPVMAWRQGVYGPALVAAGLDGYECGMGIGEHANVRGFINTRKPRDKDGPAFAAQGTYIPVLGRSLPPKVARVLFEDRRLRGRLICDSVRCCPHGTDSMLISKGRRHAVRARARALQELADIPNADWRLNHIAKQAASAYVIATKANELLETTELPNRIKTDGYAALEQVAEFLRTRGPGSVRDSASDEAGPSRS